MIRARIGVSHRRTRGSGARKGGLGPAGWRANRHPVTRAAHRARGRRAADDDAV